MLGMIHTKLSKIDSMAYYTNNAVINVVYTAKLNSTAKV
jgi:hypothetical protein